VPVLVQAADGLLRFGSDAQRERWLPGVAKGELFLTAALHEHGVEDPTRPTTSVRRDGDGFVLTGEKNFVSAAQAAARILVPATADDGEVLLFLVDPAAHGVTIERQRSTNKEALARLTLAGVAVAEADRVGEPGRGAAILRSILDRNAAALCVLQLGVSERAIEITAEYGRTREQFDRPIGSFQAFHQRAADAYIQLEAQRLTAWEAVWRLAADEDAREQLATARYWAVAGGQMAGYAAQHLHGGIGVDVDYPVHRHYQWTKQLSLLLGGRNAQLAAIGAELAR
jgi:alkylation response protein AidB-like acyl-CoA dehydrogenase